MTPFGTPENSALKQKVREVLTFANRFSGATQTVNDQQQDSRRTPVKQGVHAASPQPNKIGPATPYDFDGKNLTAYGGLLPVGTLLEKLGFQQTGGGDAESEAADQVHASVSIHPGDGAGLLRGFLTTASPAVSPARADADGNLGGAAAPAAMYLLAVPGLPTQQP